jgi:hypothetical protein
VSGGADESREASGLVKEFGAKYALTESLAMALQFSQVVAREKGRALRLAVASTGREVLDYVERFRQSMPEDVVRSQEYAFRVFLVPKVAGRPGSADVAVEFVPYNTGSPDEIEQLKKLTALIKERHVPVANLDLFKPGQVVAKVKANIPHPFNPNLHARAWQHYGVRPPGKSDRPERTKAQYCPRQGAR